ncbi:glycerophosphodiester phosphodiesterase [Halobacteriales archaeon QS_1_68_20]|nr:MAG: glycerophosphodiester phosphodiesterase [Halobacteriales archaeon QS_1_68_20]
MRLIAHRGFALTFPENTRYAVQAAADVADLVEVDVRRCGSGELVVVHDETVDRVTDGTGRVADRRLPELRDLDVFDSGEPIPTLAAVVDAVPAEVGLVLDLKEADVAADAPEIAATADNDVLVSATDAETLAAAQDAAPGVPRAVVFDRDPEQGLRLARDFECAAVHPHHESATPGLVERCHVGGFSVHAWPVADGATAARLAEANADGVIADRPDVLESVPGGA